MISMPPTLSFQQKEGVMTVSLLGQWTLSSQPPSLDGLISQLDGKITTVGFDTGALETWDSLLASTLLVLQQVCVQRGVIFDRSGLPTGMQVLLELATAVPAESQAPDSIMGFWQSLQKLAGECWYPLRDSMVFVGELALSCQRLLAGQSNLRWRDVWYFVDQAGPRALGIISLVSILAGVILAYLGAVQLRQFGAQVYVANLVSIGMTREMGALMVGIIMAGRTGAAYAAQLGTMQANEEIDALKIMGINPVDFLALPRVLALMLVLPMLTLYADILGILGGSLIAGSMDIGLTQYFTQTQASIDFQQILAGLVKSVVFAFLIAQSGCYWGLKSGRSSTDVGVATTRAVVAALVAIIVADSVINILYDRMGI